jgi:hypothetical protein
VRALRLWDNELSTSTPKIQRFTGFFPSRPFWAEAAPNLDALSDLQDLAKYKSVMTDVVFTYEAKGLRICICRDGLIMIQDAQLETEAAQNRDNQINFDGIRWWNDYLNYLNVIYFLLDASTVEVMKLGYFDLTEATNKDVFRMEFVDGVQLGESIASQSVTSVYQHARFGHGLPLFLHRQVIYKAVFDEFAKKLPHVVHDLDRVTKLSAITKSISERKLGSFKMSVVLAWFVIESILSAKWRWFLDAENLTFDDKKKRINTDRMATLTSGGDYPISVVTNFLELADVISFALWERVNTVRGFRNAIVHGKPDYVCKPEHSEQAILLALDLALEGVAVSAKPNLSLSIPGF